MAAHRESTYPSMTRTLMKFDIFSSALPPVPSRTVVRPRTRRELCSWRKHYSAPVRSKERKHHGTKPHAIGPCFLGRKRSCNTPFRTEGVRTERRPAGRAAGARHGGRCWEMEGGACRHRRLLLERCGCVCGRGLLRF